MFSFAEFIAEGAGEDSGPTHNGAIAHLVHHDHAHLTDNHAQEATVFSLRSLQNMKNGLDGKSTDSAIKHTNKADGKIAVSIGKHKGKHYAKYKGTNAKKCFSQQDVDDNYGPNGVADKPHVHKALSHVVAHAQHIVPKKEDNVEYQADVMHSGHDSDAVARVDSDNSVKPNYLKYKFGDIKKTNKIGVAITAKAKLDLDGNAHSISQNIPAAAGSHPHIHKFDTKLNLDSGREHMSEKASATFEKHHGEATRLHNVMAAKGHYGHINGHGTHMQTYLNSLMDSGSKPSTAGYKKHLKAVGEKAASKVKTEKSKSAKIAAHKALIDHVSNHKEAFDNAIALHTHKNKAVGAIMPALMKSTNPKISQTHPDGSAADHEGVVSSEQKPGQKMIAMKAVPEKFRRGNREQGQKFKAARLAK